LKRRINLIVPGERMFDYFDDRYIDGDIRLVSLVDPSNSVQPEENRSSVQVRNLLNVLNLYEGEYEELVRQSNVLSKEVEMAQKRLNYLNDQLSSVKEGMARSERKIREANKSLQKEM
jgi:chromosome segregation ATPase